MSLQKKIVRKDGSKKRKRSKIRSKLMQNYIEASVEAMGKLLFRKDPFLEALERIENKKPTDAYWKVRV